MPISMNNTTLTFNNGTTMTTAATGTVTSVATGNGLQGGTITSTGTLSVACPTFNSVGSYIMGGNASAVNTFTAGSNYSAGSGANQIEALNVRNGGSDTQFDKSGVSGTWKWMAATTNFNDQAHVGVCCRVS